MSRIYTKITLAIALAISAGVILGPVYAVPQVDNDAPVVTPLKVKGSLTLTEKVDALKSEPRLAAVVFKLVANKPGDTSYKLTCTGGRTWTGTLNTFKIGPDKYQAIGQQVFKITKTELIGCALRSMSKPNHAVVALASKQFLLTSQNLLVGDGSGNQTDKPVNSQLQAQGKNAN